MRRLIVLSIVFFGLGTHGANARGPKLSQLSDGKLSGDLYFNETLGVRVVIPRDWTPTLGLDEAAGLERIKTNRPANECVKGLLIVRAPRGTDQPTAVAIFVMDPACFAGMKFPKSEKDKQKVIQFADKIVPALAHTHVIARSGADIDATRKGGHTIVLLSGDEQVDMGEKGAPQKKTLYISLSLIELNGYWLAWAGWTFDSSRETLRQLDIQLATR